MRISDAFPSKHLKASDLQGRRVTVVMSRVDLEKLGDDQKPVLYFRGKDKGLVLNKTNSNMIADTYGDDTTAWTGRPIEIYPARVEFQGKIVDGLRVSVPQQHTQAPLASHETAPPMQRAPQQRQPAMASDFTEDAPPPPQHTQQRGVSGIDDEIPF
jgi:hypothetical protein